MRFQEKENLHMVPTRAAVRVAGDTYTIITQLD
jgi:hypothetical protein